MLDISLAFPADRKRQRGTADFRARGGAVRPAAQSLLATGRFRATGVPSVPEHGRDGRGTSQVTASPG